MLKKIPLHTFLFAFLPVIYLYLNNFEKTKFISILPPLFINTAIGLFVLAFVYLLTKNARQAGIESTIILILFSTLGHTIHFALSKQLFLTDQRPIIVGYIVTFIILTWLLFRVFSDFQLFTEILNVIAIVFLLIVGSNFLRNANFQNFERSSLPIISSPQPASTPDIYFIILDGYGGEEMLSKVYDFDNQQFISFLERNGFYVAHKSKANYVRTIQSLSSTLNLDYLADNNWMADTTKLNYSYFIHSINHSLVNNQLEYFNYQIYTTPNSFGTSDWENAEKIGQIPFGTPFLWEYMRTTALVLFWNALPYTAHRTQVLNNFNLLDNSVELPSPKFVFAHILSPHPPFVFKIAGGITQPSHPFTLYDANDLGYPVNTYQTRYVQQLQFINTKLEETISLILEKSENPPIIIIQGDHGPGSMFDFHNLEKNNCLYERLSILNAYFLPEYDYNQLYPEISPVNTFRVIFDHYFDLKFDRLVDQSFYSSSEDKMNLTDITDILDYKFCAPIP